jgi:DNA (cytosine-5)-methyltransferase 1
VAAKVVEALDVAPVKPRDPIDLGDPTLLALDMSQAASKYGVPADVIPKRTRVGSVAS